jgi:hypothetical protein
MKTKPEPKVCAICENVIMAPQPFQEGYYNVKGHVQKALAHTACAWMEGVKSLVRALYHALQEKRARERAQASR